MPFSSLRKHSFDATLIDIYGLNSQKKNNAFRSKKESYTTKYRCKMLKEDMRYNTYSKKNPYCTVSPNNH